MPKGYQRDCNYPMMPLIKDLASFWMAKRVDFPYRCETCGKGYQHRATLVRHTRHECGKEPQFKYLPWSGYHYYTRTNNQHKPPLTSDSLKIPQRSSSCLDRRPGCFRCPRCNKGYRWLRNMKNHLKIECGKDPKECCPYCPHRTKYKSSLQKHILRIHFG
nr:putative zinc finger protein 727 [Nomia melanderi]